ncbi:TonB-dependent receptor domain-containing protein [Sphingomonas sp.]|uniref:TonB-dependent receptor domain-containing protein n=1 Tax=Sphingomonas sp. TaxID=28214 RepID=UPI003AFF6782
MPGNDADLKTQKNTGVEIGAELAIGRTLTAELTGYYDRFRNEQVTQSAGIGLLSSATNVPSSVHRGVELAAEWRPDLLTGGYLQVNYSYNDQHYTRYVERLTSGAVSAAFDRNGNHILSVIPPSSTPGRATAGGRGRSRASAALPS